VLETINKMRLELAEGDAKRDAGLTAPENIVRRTDISYGEDKLNGLDVYYPVGTDRALPTIVSIHGGAWYYGDKELYSHYCMRLAQRGFTVVNFSYRLAPEFKYPAPLEDACAVLRWMQENAADYYIDLDNVFTVGDSAGAQIELQLLCMLTNPEYAALFHFAPPEGFRVRAAALNCGCYFIPLSRLVSPRLMGIIFKAYFPEDYIPLLRQIKAHKYVTSAFPPSVVMSASHDYLKFMAAPMYRILKRRGVEARLDLYGEKGQEEYCHVFHVNCYLEGAARCNDEQCEFFRKHMKTT